MQYRFPRPIINMILACGLILSAWGCAAPSLSSQESSGSPPGAGFVTLDSGVKLISAQNSEADIQPYQSSGVQTGDRIEVGGDGRGILTLPGLLDVEVYRNGQVVLEDTKTESGGSINVSLRLIQGAVAVRLGLQGTVQVTLKTIHATIATLQDGTEFLACQAPEILTCIKVLKGSVEVSAQGQRKTVRDGEATYVLKGKPPEVVVCAPDQQFIAWKDQIRTSADAPDVGALVAQLPQQPCAGGASQASGGLPSSAGMVKVNQGTYKIGRAEADEFHTALREISLGEFWIDINEVTNSQYQAYLGQTGGQATAFPPGEENRPARGVTWDQAVAYCASAGKRLPAEAEWEAAGRGGPGPDGTRYPWGDNPDASGQISSLPLDTTYDVGSVPFNVSFFGVHDMVGSVWQWVAQPYDSVPEGAKILKGGQFGFIVDLAYRRPAKPDDASFVPVAGIRCAADQVKE